MKITKRSVDTAAPDASGDIFIWDDDVRGFGIRVWPSGAKTYLVQYRTGGRGSQVRRFVLGRHGVLTPNQARARAQQALAEVAAGNDPAALRDEKRASMKVADLADLYLAEGPADKPNKKASSWGTDRSNIERHIKPLLGRKIARSLQQHDVAKFQTDVAAGKSKADIKTKRRGRAIVDGGPGTAARSLAVLGAMLQFAVKRKLIPENPAKGVPLLKLKPKERFLSDAEVSALADAMAAMEAEVKLSRVAATAIRLLLLTGCRKSEILGLRWEWVDFERMCLRLPDSKTGAKTVPLASAALELLSALPRRAPFVLPAGKGKGHYTGLQHDWERVRERAGLPGVRVHDLRHSFASFAVAGGDTLFMVGKVLGHRQARTTEGYAHLQTDPLLAVAERTASRIAAAMKGQRGGAGTVPFAPRGAKQ